MAALGATFSKDCGSCPIRHRAVCARCEPDELLRLEEIKYYRSFEPGQTVIWSGDKMDFVASVVSGVATLSQTMEDGRTQMVGLLLPSDFVGRPGRDRAAHDVKAVTPVVMCCFRRKPFEELLDRTPHLGARLLEMMLDELDAAREWMLILGRKTAREKIASFVWLCARRAAMLKQAEPEDGIELDLPLTREQIADYLGLTIETVSRQVSALKKEGIIDLVDSRTLNLPDIDRLRRAAGDDV